ncbi:cytochrome P450 [Hypoxylon rubiginosum]|uniref:Cytochrome P450 n=1 Tax=Hypoxylon rubiginosum TaxID=110542 RepID=A0ACB9YSS6_9PEZI|nr:cytochrome P450 [Hypoxylon rubiginosum]
MSAMVSPTMLFTAVISVAWLLWNLYGKVSLAKSLPGIPLVEFEGDNSRERYPSDAGNLLSKGYETTAYAARGAGAEKRNDFIQWIMDSYRANGKSITPDESVQNIFIVMFASMHGTSFVALQSLFSLFGTPGALAEIREEVERVAKDKLRDSPETLWMKPFQEAQPRSNASPCPRIHSKDGLHVPAGTVVSFPNLRYNTDPTRPLTPEAGTFDGKRWLRRRAGFDDAFDWGTGPHACPGRLMAGITIKLILVCLVTKYDMKFPDGGPGRLAETRRFMDLSPDTSTPVMVKDVRG